MNVFNIPDQKQSSSFQLQYDKIQWQLECIAGMDNLLSGLLSKSLGQILRISATLHVLFHLQEEEPLPTTISESAIDAAINFFDVCCQHAAFISGRGNLKEILESGHVAAPIEKRLEEKSALPSNESFVLTLPGNVLDVSYLVNIKKKFRHRGGREAALKAMRSLEEDKLGKLVLKHNPRSSVKAWVFHKSEVPTDNAEKRKMANLLENKYNLSLLEYLKNLTESNTHNQECEKKKQVEIEVDSPEAVPGTPKIDKEPPAKKLKF